MENFIYTSNFFSGLFFIILHVYTWTSINATLRIHSSVPILREEFVKIKITTPTTEKSRTKRDSGTIPVGSNLLPHELSISFALGGDYIHLDLKKNRKLDNAPVPIQTTFSDNSVRSHRLSSIKHVGSYYQSKDKMVNIHLECTSNTSSTCTHYQMFGTFEHNSDLHIIEPTIQPIDLGGECDIHRIVKTMPIQGFMFDHLNLLNNKARQQASATKTPSSQPLQKQRNPDQKSSQSSSSATSGIQPKPGDTELPVTDVKKQIPKMHIKVHRVPKRKRQRKGKKQKPKFRVTIHKIPRRRKVHRSRKTNRKNKKKAKASKPHPGAPKSRVLNIPVPADQNIGKASDIPIHMIPGFFDLPDLKADSNGSPGGLVDDAQKSPDKLLSERNKTMSRFFYPSLKMKGVHHFGKFPGTETDNLSPNTERVSVGDISGGDNPFKHEERPADIGTLHSPIVSSDELSSTNTDVNFDPLADILGKHHTVKKRASSSYLIEVYIIVDYQIYDFWLNEENFDDDKAMQRIRQYYVFLINGVDNRYRDITANYQIEVTLIGIYVAKTRRDLTYVQDNIVCNGNPPCKLNANKAVAGVRKWVKDKKIPQYDHVMTFTRHDMISGGFDTAGTAFLNSICTSRSHSVVEDRFDFIAATVAAHEIGHALGAVHDGENNACSKTLRYIMVSISSAMTKPYHRNPWKFSKCTVREIGLYLDKLNKGKEPHCMHTRDPNARNYDSMLQTKLGQTFHIDKQCEFIVGKGSYACRSFIGNGNFEDVCTGLWCKVLERFSSKCLLALPAEGTSCADNKLCNGYKCEFDSSAPGGSDGCIFGDYPGIILKGLDCSDLIILEPYQCYSTSIRKNCCESCNKIKSNDPDCEYGDKSLECLDALSNGQCSSYRNECCKTCR